MSDISTIWDSAASNGDWELVQTTITSTPISFGSASYFGKGDGSTTVFSVVGGAGNVDTVVVSAIYEYTGGAFVTLTDYTVDSYGNVTFTTAPASGVSLSWTGSYNLNTVSGGGYLEYGDDLATAILISLYTDRSANADDTIPDGTTDRRGWWGDSGADYNIGSRLWLLNRAKQTDATLQSAFDYVQEALKWMLDDGAVGQFEITVQWVKASTLGITVTAIKDGTSVASVSYASLWDSP